MDAEIVPVETILLWLHRLILKRRLNGLAGFSGIGVSALHKIAEGKNHMTDRTQIRLSLLMHRFRRRELKWRRSRNGWKVVPSNADEVLSEGRYTPVMQIYVSGFLKRIGYDRRVR